MSEDKSNWVVPKDGIFFGDGKLLEPKKFTDVRKEQHGEKKPPQEQEEAPRS